MYTHYSLQQMNKIFAVGRSVYFIGIGGISMSSLAHIAHDRGCKVGGYDRTPSSLTAALADCGITIYDTLDASHIADYDVIVYTAAIHPDNIELAAALEADKAGTKYCIYRADFLGWLMSACENRIGVAGMHGKSTTTAMLTHIFMSAMRNPTVVLGAELPVIGGAYRLGSQRDFIMEACEYQDSFLSFTPNIAVVLNIDLDHTDYFSGLEQIRDSFRRYLSIAADANGTAVVNTDDANVRTVIENDTGKTVSFGLQSNADFTAADITFENGCPCFTVLRYGKPFAHIRMHVTGRHNIMNALAAAAAADCCGVTAGDIEKGLAAFDGAKRRMELRGNMTAVHNVTVPVYDDYAHHPTEIKATLSGALAMGKNHVWVVFQPHTYSRTASLFDEFAAAFAGTNVIFADIYAAREVNTFEVSSEALAKAAHGLYLPSLNDIAAYLRTHAAENDMIIVMGAGDIIQLSAMLLKN